MLLKSTESIIYVNLGKQSHILIKSLELDLVQLRLRECF